MWNTDETTTQIEDQSTPIIDENGEVTYCTPDACPSILKIINDILSATYHAHTLLESDGRILNGEDVKFKAGINILLNAGFEVKPGAKLEVLIEACDSP